VIKERSPSRVIAGTSPFLFSTSGGCTAKQVPRITRSVLIMAIGAPVTVTKALVKVIHPFDLNALSQRRYAMKHCPVAVIA